MTSSKSGIRLVFTSATSPWAIRRLVASPLAETPSYWVPPPCRISVTISSDVSANFTLILQPVAVVKGVTQSTLGSVLPLSTYPVQAMRFKAVSFGPMLCGRFDPVWALFDVPPQAASTSMAAVDAMRFARYGFIRSAPSSDRQGGRAGEDVRGADKAGDEAGRRPLVHLGRAADLLYPPLVHHRHAVAHRQRFLLVVGHVDEGHRKPLLD